MPRRVPRRIGGSGRGELALAIVGAGRWGRRLLRVFSSTPGARVVAVCDSDPKQLGELRRIDPALECFSSMEALLERPALDAVVIATPSPSHARLVLLALDAHKHVFVEKPMAMRLADALAINARAQSSGKRVMVGHVLEYHPSVERANGWIRAGKLGEPRFVLCERFGLTTSGSNPWWELAPHDFSLIRRFAGQEARSVAARYAGSESIDALIGLPGKVRARISVGRSLLRPRARTAFVVGTQGVAVFRGVTAELQLLLPRAGMADWLSGFEERWATADLSAEVAAEGFSVEQSFSSTIEPLAREAEHFVAALLDSAEIRSDAHGGLRVVAALCAGERSLAQGGLAIPVSAEPAPWRSSSPLHPEPAVEL